MLRRILAGLISQLLNVFVTKPSFSDIIWEKWGSPIIIERLPLKPMKINNDFQLHSSFIRKIEILIPWNFWSATSKIVLKIDTILAVIVPFYNAPSVQLPPEVTSPDALLKMFLSPPRHRSPLLRTISNVALDIGLRILRRTNIEITNVHICYEHGPPASNVPGGRPFQVGVTLHSLKLGPSKQLLSRSTDIALLSPKDTKNKPSVIPTNLANESDTTTATTIDVTHLLDAVVIIEGFGVYVLPDNFELLSISDAESHSAVYRSRMSLGLIANRENLNHFKQFRSLIPYQRSNLNSIQSQNSKKSLSSLNAPQKRLITGKHRLKLLSHAFVCYLPEFTINACMPKASFLILPSSNSTSNSNNIKKTFSSSKSPESSSFNEIPAAFPTASSSSLSSPSSTLLANNTQSTNSNSPLNERASLTICLPVMCMRVHPQQLESACLLSSWVASRKIVDLPTTVENKDNSELGSERRRSRAEEDTASSLRSPIRQPAHSFPPSHSASPIHSQLQNNHLNSTSRNLKQSNNYSDDDDDMVSAVSSLHPSFKSSVFVDFSNRNKIAKHSSNKWNPANLFSNVISSIKSTASRGANSAFSAVSDSTAFLIKTVSGTKGIYDSPTSWPLFASGELSACIDKIDFLVDLRSTAMVTEARTPTKFILSRSVAVRNKTSLNKNTSAEVAGVDQYFISFSLTDLSLWSALAVGRAPVSLNLGWYLLGVRSRVSVGALDLTAMGRKVDGKSSAHIWGRNAGVRIAIDEKRRILDALSCLRVGFAEKHDELSASSSSFDQNLFEEDDDDNKLKSRDSAHASESDILSMISSSENDQNELHNVPGGEKDLLDSMMEEQLDSLLIENVIVGGDAGSGCMTGARLSLSSQLRDLFAALSVMRSIENNSNLHTPNLISKKAKKNSTRKESIFNSSSLIDNSTNDTEQWSDRLGMVVDQQEETMRSMLGAGVDMGRVIGVLHQVLMEFEESEILKNHRNEKNKHEEDYFTNLNQRPLNKNSLQWISEFHNKIHSNNSSNNISSASQISSSTVVSDDAFEFCLDWTSDRNSRICLFEGRSSVHPHAPYLVTPSFDDKTTTTNNIQNHLSSPLSNGISHKSQPSNDKKTEFTASSNLLLNSSGIFNDGQVVQPHTCRMTAELAPVAVFVKPKSLGTITSELIGAVAGMQTLMKTISEFTDFMRNHKEDVDDSDAQFNQRMTSKHVFNDEIQDLDFQPTFDSDDENENYDNQPNSSQDGLSKLPFASSLTGLFIQSVLDIVSATEVQMAFDMHGIQLTTCTSAALPVSCSFSQEGNTEKDLFEGGDKQIENHHSQHEIKELTESAVFVFRIVSANVKFSMPCKPLGFDYIIKHFHEKTVSANCQYLLTMASNESGSTDSTDYIAKKDIGKHVLNDKSTVETSLANIQCSFIANINGLHAAWSLSRVSIPPPFFHPSSIALLTVLPAAFIEDITHELQLEMATASNNIAHLHTDLVDSSILPLRNNLLAVAAWQYVILPANFSANIFSKARVDAYANDGSWPFPSLSSNIQLGSSDLTVVVDLSDKFAAFSMHMVREFMACLNAVSIRGEDTSTFACVMANVNDVMSTLIDDQSLCESDFASCYDGAGSKSRSMKWRRDASSTSPAASPLFVRPGSPSLLVESDRGRSDSVASEDLFFDAFEPLPSAMIGTGNTVAARQMDGSHAATSNFVPLARDPKDSLLSTLTTTNLNEAAMLSPTKGSEGMKRSQWNSNSASSLLAIFNPLAARTIASVSIEFSSRLASVSIVMQRVASPKPLAPARLSSPALSVLPASAPPSFYSSRAAFKMSSLCLALEAGVSIVSCPGSQGRASRIALVPNPLLTSGHSAEAVQHMISSIPPLFLGEVAMDSSTVRDLCGRMSGQVDSVSLRTYRVLDAEIRHAAQSNYIISPHRNAQSNDGVFYHHHSSREDATFSYPYIPALPVWIIPGSQSPISYMQFADTSNLSLSHEDSLSISHSLLHPFEPLLHPIAPPPANFSSVSPLHPHPAANLSSSLSDSIFSLLNDKSVKSMNTHPPLRQANTTPIRPKQALSTFTKTFPSTVIPKGHCILLLDLQPAGYKNTVFELYFDSSSAGNNQNDAHAASNNFAADSSKEDPFLLPLSSYLSWCPPPPIPFARGHPALYFNYAVTRGIMEVLPFEVQIRSDKGDLMDSHTSAIANLLMRKLAQDSDGKQSASRDKHMHGAHANNKEFIGESINLLNSRPQIQNGRRDSNSSLLLTGSNGGDDLDSRIRLRNNTESSKRSNLLNEDDISDEFVDAASVSSDIDEDVFAHSPSLNGIQNADKLPDDFTENPDFNNQNLSKVKNDRRTQHVNEASPFRLEHQAFFTASALLASLDPSSLRGFVQLTSAASSLINCASFTKQLSLNHQGGKVNIDQESDENYSETINASPNTSTESPLPPGASEIYSFLRTSRLHSVRTLFSMPSVQIHMYSASDPLTCGSRICGGKGLQPLPATKFPLLQLASNDIITCNQARACYLSMSTQLAAEIPGMRALVEPALAQPWWEKACHENGSQSPSASSDSGNEFAGGAGAEKSPLYLELDLLLTSMVTVSGGKFSLCLVDTPLEVQRISFMKHLEIANQQVNMLNKQNGVSSGDPQASCSTSLLKNLGVLGTRPPWPSPPLRDADKQLEVRMSADLICVKIHRDNIQIICASHPRSSPLPTAPLTPLRSFEEVLLTTQQLHDSTKMATVFNIGSLTDSALAFETTWLSRARERSRSPIPCWWEVGDVRTRVSFPVAELELLDTMNSLWLLAKLTQLIPVPTPKSLIPLISVPPPSPPKVPADANRMIPNESSMSMLPPAANSAAGLSGSRASPTFHPLSSTPCASPATMTQPTPLFTSLPSPLRTAGNLNSMPPPRDHAPPIDSDSSVPPLHSPTPPHKKKTTHFSTLLPRIALDIIGSSMVVHMDALGVASCRVSVSHARAMFSPPNASSLESLLSSSFPSGITSVDFSDQDVSSSFDDKKIENDKTSKVHTKRETSLSLPPILLRHSARIGLGVAGLSIDLINNTIVSNNNNNMNTNNNTNNNLGRSAETNKRVFQPADNIFFMSRLQLHLNIAQPLPQPSSSPPRGSRLSFIISLDGPQACHPPSSVHCRLPPSAPLPVNSSIHIHITPQLLRTIVLMQCAVTAGFTVWLQGLCSSEVEFFSSDSGNTAVKVKAAVAAATEALPPAPSVLRAVIVQSAPIFIIVACPPSGSAAVGATTLVSTCHTRAPPHVTSGSTPDRNGLLGSLLVIAVRESNLVLSCRPADMQLCGLQVRMRGPIVTLTADRTSFLDALVAHSQPGVAASGGHAGSFGMDTENTDFQNFTSGFQRSQMNVGANLASRQYESFSKHNNPQGNNLYGKNATTKSMSASTSGGGGISGYSYNDYILLPLIDGEYGDGGSVGNIQFMCALASELDRIGHSKLSQFLIDSIGSDSGGNSIDALMQHYLQQQQQQQINASINNNSRTGGTYLDPTQQQQQQPQQPQNIPYSKNKGLNQGAFNPTSFREPSLSLISADPIVSAKAANKVMMVGGSILTSSIPSRAIAMGVEIPSIFRKKRNEKQSQANNNSTSRLVNSTDNRLINSSNVSQNVLRKNLKNDEWSLRDSVLLRHLQNNNNSQTNVGLAQSDVISNQSVNRRPRASNIGDWQTSSEWINAMPGGFNSQVNKRYNGKQQQQQFHQDGNQKQQWDNRSISSFNTNANPAAIEFNNVQNNAPDNIGHSNQFNNLSSMNNYNQLNNSTDINNVSNTSFSNKNSLYIFLKGSPTSSNDHEVNNSNTISTEETNIGDNKGNLSLIVSVPAIGCMAPTLCINSCAALVRSIVAELRMNEAYMNPKINNLNSAGHAHKDLFQFFISPSTVGIKASLFNLGQRPYTLTPPPSLAHFNREDADDEEEERMLNNNIDNWAAIGDHNEIGEIDIDDRSEFNEDAPRSGLSPNLLSESANLQTNNPSQPLLSTEKKAAQEAKTDKKNNKSFFESSMAIQAAQFLLKSAVSIKISSKGFTIMLPSQPVLSFQPSLKEITSAASLRSNIQTSTPGYSGSNPQRHLQVGGGGGSQSLNTYMSNPRRNRDHVIPIMHHLLFHIGDVFISTILTPPSSTTQLGLLNVLAATLPTTSLELKDFNIYGGAVSIPKPFSALSSPFGSSSKNSQRVQLPSMSHPNQLNGTLVPQTPWIKCLRAIWIPSISQFTVTKLQNISTALIPQVVAMSSSMNNNDPSFSNVGGGTTSSINNRISSVIPARFQLHLPIHTSQKHYIKNSSQQQKQHNQASASSPSPSKICSSIFMPLGHIDDSLHDFESNESEQGWTNLPNLHAIRHTSASHNNTAPLNVAMMNNSFLDVLFKGSVDSVIMTDVSSAPLLDRPFSFSIGALLSCVNLWTPSNENTDDSFSAHHCSEDSSPGNRLGKMDEEDLNGQRNHTRINNSGGGDTNLMELDSQEMARKGGKSIPDLHLEIDCKLSRISCLLIPSDIKIMALVGFAIQNFVTGVTEISTVVSAAHETAAATSRAAYSSTAQLAAAPFIILKRTNNIKSSKSAELNVNKDKLKHDNDIVMATILKKLSIALEVNNLQGISISFASDILCKPCLKAEVSSVQAAAHFGPVRQSRCWNPLFVKNYNQSQSENNISNSSLLNCKHTSNAAASTRIKNNQLPTITCLGTLFSHRLKLLDVSHLLLPINGGRPAYPWIYRFDELNAPILQTNNSNSNNNMSTNNNTNYFLGSRPSNTSLYPSVKTFNSANAHIQPKHDEMSSHDFKSFVDITPPPRCGLHINGVFSSVAEKRSLPVSPSQHASHIYSPSSISTGTYGGGLSAVNLDTAVEFPSARPPPLTRLRTPPQPRVSTPPVSLMRHLMHPASLVVEFLPGQPILTDIDSLLFTITPGIIETFKDLHETVQACLGFNFSSPAEEAFFALSKPKFPLFHLHPLISSLPFKSNAAYANSDPILEEESASIVFNPRIVNSSHNFTMNSLGQDDPVAVSMYQASLQNDSALAECFSCANDGNRMLIGDMRQLHALGPSFTPSSLLIIENWTRDLLTVQMTTGASLGSTLEVNNMQSNASFSTSPAILLQSGMRTMQWSFNILSTSPDCLSDAFLVITLGSSKRVIHIASLLDPSISSPSTENFPFLPPPSNLHFLCAQPITIGPIATIRLEPPLRVVSALQDELFVTFLSSISVEDHGQTISPGGFGLALPLNVASACAAMNVRVAKTDAVPTTNIPCIPVPPSVLSAVEQISTNITNNNSNNNVNKTKSMSNDHVFREMSNSNQRMNQQHANNNNNQFLSTIQSPRHPNQQQHIVFPPSTSTTPNLSYLSILGTESVSESRGFTCGAAVFYASSGAASLTLFPLVKVHNRLPNSIQIRMSHHISNLTTSNSFTANGAGAFRHNANSPQGTSIKPGMTYESSKLDWRKPIYLSIAATPATNLSGTGDMWMEKGDVSAASEGNYNSHNKMSLMWSSPLEIVIPPKAFSTFLNKRAKPPLSLMRKFSQIVEIDSAIAAQQQNISGGRFDKNSSLLVTNANNNSNINNINNNRSINSVLGIGGGGASGSLSYTPGVRSTLALDGDAMKSASASIEDHSFTYSTLAENATSPSRLNNQNNGVFIRSPSELNIQSNQQGYFNDNNVFSNNEQGIFSFNNDQNAQHDIDSYQNHLNANVDDDESPYDENPNDQICSDDSSLPYTYTFCISTPSLDSPLSLRVHLTFDGFTLGIVVDAPTWVVNMTGHSLFISPLNLDRQDFDSVSVPPCPFLVPPPVPLVYKDGRTLDSKMVSLSASRQLASIISRSAYIPTDSFPILRPCYDPFYLSSHGKNLISTSNMIHNNNDMNSNIVRNINISSSGFSNAQMNHAIPFGDANWLADRLISSHPTLFSQSFRRCQISLDSPPNSHSPMLDLMTHEQCSSNDTAKIIEVQQGTHVLQHSVRVGSEFGGVDLVVLRPMYLVVNCCPFDIELTTLSNPENEINIYESANTNNSASNPTLSDINSNNGNNKPFRSTNIGGLSPNLKIECSLPKKNYFSLACGRAANLTWPTSGTERPLSVRRSGAHIEIVEQSLVNSYVDSIPDNNSNNISSIGQQPFNNNNQNANQNVNAFLATSGGSAVVSKVRLQPAWTSNVDLEVTRDGLFNSLVNASAVLIPPLGRSNKRNTNINNTTSRSGGDTSTTTATNVQGSANSGAAKLRTTAGDSFLSVFGLQRKTVPESSVHDLSVSEMSNTNGNDEDSSAKPRVSMKTAISSLSATSAPPRFFDKRTIIDLFHIRTVESRQMRIVFVSAPYDVESVTAPQPTLPLMLRNSLSVPIWISLVLPPEKGGFLSKMFLSTLSQIFPWKKDSTSSNYNKNGAHNDTLGQYDLPSDQESSSTGDNFILQIDPNSCLPLAIPPGLQVENLLLKVGFFKQCLLSNNNNQSEIQSNSTTDHNKNNTQYDNYISNNVNNNVECKTALYPPGSFCNVLNNHDISPPPGATSSQRSDCRLCLFNLPLTSGSRSKGDMTIVFDVEPNISQQFDHLIRGNNYNDTNQSINGLHSATGKESMSVSNIYASHIASLAKAPDTERAIKFSVEAKVELVLGAVSVSISGFALPPVSYLTCVAPFSGAANSIMSPPLAEACAPLPACMASLLWRRKLGFAHPLHIDALNLGGISALLSVAQSSSLNVVQGRKHTFFGTNHTVNLSTGSSIMAASSSSDLIMSHHRMKQPESNDRLSTYPTTSPPFRVIFLLRRAVIDLALTPENLKNNSQALPKNSTFSLSSPPQISLVFENFNISLDMQRQLTLASSNIQNNKNYFKRDGLSKRMRGDFSNAELPEHKRTTLRVKATLDRFFILGASTDQKSSQSLGNSASDNNAYGARPSRQQNNRLYILKVSDQDHGLDPSTSSTTNHLLSSTVSGVRVISNSVILDPSNSQNTNIHSVNDRININQPNYSSVGNKRNTSTNLNTNRNIDRSNNIVVRLPSQPALTTWLDVILPVSSSSIISERQYNRNRNGSAVNDDGDDKTETHQLSSNSQPNASIILSPLTRQQQSLLGLSPQDYFYSDNSYSNSYNYLYSSLDPSYNHSSIISPSAIMNLLASRMDVGAISAAHHSRGALLQISRFVFHLIPMSLTIDTNLPGMSLNTQIKNFESQRSAAKQELIRVCSTFSSHCGVGVLSTPSTSDTPAALAVASLAKMTFQPVQNFPALPEDATTLLIPFTAELAAVSEALLMKARVSTFTNQRDPLGPPLHAVLARRAQLSRQLAALKERTIKRSFYFFASSIWVQSIRLEVSVHKIAKVVMLEKALVSLDALKISEALLTPADIVRIVRQHYHLRQLMLQLVLALDLVGKPLSKARGLWKAVRDSSLKFVFGVNSGGSSNTQHVPAVMITDLNNNIITNKSNTLLSTNKVSNELNTSMNINRNSTDVYGLTRQNSITSHSNPSTTLNPNIEGETTAATLMRSTSLQPRSRAKPNNPLGDDFKVSMPIDEGGNVEDKDKVDDNNANNEKNELKNEENGNILKRAATGRSNNTSSQNFTNSSSNTQPATENSVSRIVRNNNVNIINNNNNNNNNNNSATNQNTPLNNNFRSTPLLGSSVSPSMLSDRMSLENQSTRALLSILLSSGRQDQSGENNER